MNCVYSRQDNREILGSDEDSLSAKLKGLFSIHPYLVTKDDKDVFYTLSQILLISALKIRQSFIQVEA